MSAATAVDWEALWSPYDEGTYAAVLAEIAPHDVVLDIGAGDLRLARAMAARTTAVVAIERNLAVAAGAAALPPNCEPLPGDARFLPFPRGITTAVLLMRHCAHFALYVRKLREVGCPRLITNARWGFGPEVIDLTATRLPYRDLPVGWFACDCGHTGFVPGPLDLLNAARADLIVEVAGCPACAPQAPQAAERPRTAVHQAN